MTFFCRTHMQLLSFCLLSGTSYLFNIANPTESTEGFEVFMIVFAHLDDSCVLLFKHTIHIPELV